MRWDAKLAIAVAVVGISLLSGDSSLRAAQGVAVGMATKVVSPAQVNQQPAAVGTLAHMNDELHTGAKARLQVSFRDSTELTLGENATVVVDHFIFDPDESTGTALLKTGVGAFRMATGKISELKDKKITVSTPYATLGVRGTDFWWGPVDGRFGVLLISQSKLEVRNDAGAVLIDKAGYGTDIDPMKGANGAPSQPYKWPPAKVAQALSQTNVAVLTPVNPGIIAPLVPIIPVTPQQPGPKSP